MTTVHRLSKILAGRGDKQKLADAIGRPASIISDLCSGKDRINDDLIKDISAALGIPPWQLFVDPDEIYPQEDKKVVLAYRCLTDDDRRIVDKFLWTEKKSDPPLKTQEFHGDRQEYADY